MLGFREGPRGVSPDVDLDVRTGVSSCPVSWLIPTMSWRWSPRGSWGSGSMATPIP